MRRVKGTTLLLALLASGCAGAGPLGGTSGTATGDAPTSPQAPLSVGEGQLAVAIAAIRPERQAQGWTDFVGYFQVDVTTRYTQRTRYLTASTYDTTPASNSVTLTGLKVSDATVSVQAIDPDWSTVIGSLSATVSIQSGVTTTLPLALPIARAWNLVTVAQTRLSPQVTIRDGVTLVHRGIVSTAAGSEAGFADGPGASAKLYFPWGLAMGPGGVCLVADCFNHRLRSLDTSGNLVTLAGGSAAGQVDGPAASARFNQPTGVASGPDGAIYIADSGNHCIRVLRDGTVSTLAGSATAGSADARGPLASFRSPTALTVDSQGVVFVADTGNNRIRRIQPDGTVDTLAGSVAGRADGAGAIARFDGPVAIALTSRHELYVADRGNHRVARIDAGGVVSTAIQHDNWTLWGLAVDDEDTLYLSGDDHLFALRAADIAPTALWSGVIGGTYLGMKDGPVAEAMFDKTKGVAVDASHSIYVADFGNHRIRRVD